MTATGSALMYLVSALGFLALLGALFFGYVLAYRTVNALLPDTDDEPRFDGMPCGFCGSRSYHLAGCGWLDRRDVA